MPVHLIKLAVGCAGVDDLRGFQAQRARTRPPLRHQTRNFPKRAAEIIDGGSIYWVVARVLSVRQRIVDIQEGQWDDGSRCTDLILDSKLVAVRPRTVKPFQGWRYLEAADAPADEAAAAALSDKLPEKLRRDLAALALL